MDKKIKKLLIFMVLSMFILVSGNSVYNFYAYASFASGQATNLIKPSSTNASPFGLIVNQSSISNNTLSKGVPFKIVLTYGNGSFLTSGNINYKVRFNFGEPFVISEVNKGSFDNAKIIKNDTVQFNSTPLSKGENKTGIVIFLFANGLAEKSRSVSLDTSVTVNSLRDIPQNKTSVFTNESNFKKIFGEQPKFINPSLVTSIPISNLTSKLNNLTAAELAGVVSAVPSTDRAKLLAHIQPLAPARSITQTLKIGPINSSYVQIGTVIINLANQTFILAKDIYDFVTPCISFDSLQQTGNIMNTNSGSVLQFLLKMSNCSNHPQLVQLGAESKPGVLHFFTFERFDMTAKTNKDINLVVIVPPNTVQGFNIFKILGNVLVNLGFGKTVIVSSTTGNVFYTVVS